MLNLSEKISVSIIDTIGEMNGGVGLLLSLIVFDDTYELSFWFNKDGVIRLVADDNLLSRLNLSNIYEYSRIQELIDFIYNSLPNPNKILEEILQK